ncbi:uncharacterized protein LOC117240933 [Bombus vosnesenskii]|uniref:Uncharacterized protein LOC117240933 n=1 Tax=Bombus vosnesenskii TaxID=207650 RepID=A0A6J3LBY9_9HYME|nr:uncharacterized protein LOC117240933 [Bombus vosnesenskii]
MSGGSVEVNAATGLTTVLQMPYAKHAAARLAQDLSQYPCENRVDVVFISEPYRQLPYWYNDAVGDASLWVTLFNGRHAASGTFISKEGVIGVRVEDTMCISGYCSPNVSRQEIDGYIAELEAVIRDGRRRAPALLVAGDFNAKSTTWTSRRTETRGTYLLGTLTRNELMPIRTAGTYFFARNGSKSFPDILSVSRRMRQERNSLKDEDWIHTYKELIVAKEALGSRVSMEIKDIDVLESREDLKQDTASGLRVNDSGVT